MRAGKTNVSEPLTTCRKRMDVIETRLQLLAWDEARGVPAECPSDDRHEDGVSPAQALVWNVGTFSLDAKGDSPSGGPTRSRVPKRGEGADGPVVATKPSNAGGAKGSGDLADGNGQPAMGGARA